LQFTHQVPVWPLRFFNEFAGHHVASDANAGGGQKQNATELSCGNVDPRESKLQKTHVLKIFP
jgi:hypothetical protein